MADPHLGHPGEIVWYKGFGPVPMAGECDHGCEAKDSRAIANGPDFRRYVLEQCLYCRCRAWSNDRCIPSTPWMKPAAA